MWRIFLLVTLVSVVWASGSIAEEVPTRKRVHPFVGAPDDEALVAKVLADWLPAKDLTPRIIYVAPPEGNKAGTGTKGDPYRDLLSVVRNAKKGDWIYLAPGLYDMEEIKKKWGHPHSVLQARFSGAWGNPIILSTDPERFDPSAGRIAIIDFKYGNKRKNVRASCFGLSRDSWLIENLEIRNISGRGIWVDGVNNVIRNCNIHHMNSNGSNNHGLIFFRAGHKKGERPPQWNMVIGNHLHHVGNINQKTGEIVDLGGGHNCGVYSESPQYYRSPKIIQRPGLRQAGDEVTVEAYKKAMLPADPSVYLYNNYVHHAKIGLATKNAVEGPWYFLSNVIHDVESGIRTAVSHSTVRNNVIYAGKGKLSTGIILGGMGSSRGSYLYDMNYGVGCDVSFNTIVGSRRAISLSGGWNSSSHSNLVVNETEGLGIRRNSYAWYKGGKWPGLRGEYLWEDLTPRHPFYKAMPNYLQAKSGVFKKFRSYHNVYTKVPKIAGAARQSEHEIAGKIFDEDYTVIKLEQVPSLFVDYERGNFIRNLKMMGDFGSRVTR